MNKAKFSRFHHTCALILLLATTAACTSTAVNHETRSDITRSDIKGGPRSASVAKGVINIDNRELKSLKDGNVTLVDIRLPEEWAQTGVVPGSNKLTFFSANGMINPGFVPQLKRIAPQDEPIALICRTGSRTRIASQIISAQLGYDTVYNLQNGITGWIAEGNPVVK